MIEVLTCIAVDHEPWLVVLALIVCGIGSFGAFRMFAHALRSAGLACAAWLFLASTVAGAAIWCTHFIGLQAYLAAAPVSYDPMLTTISLVVALGSANLGLAIAAAARGAAPAIGGAIVGLGIAAMHYTGMLAYRIDGTATWRPGYVVASIVLAAGLSALALVIARGQFARVKTWAAPIMLSAAIVGLHFTGMTALRIVPIDGRLPASLDSALMVALATALIGLLLVATCSFSLIIEARSQSEHATRLQDLASLDPLTGLSNRAGFEFQLSAAIARTGEAGGSFALLLIDIDHFAHINDRHGRAAGDAVLRSAARQIGPRSGAEVLVSRIGGDEFAAIKPFATRAELAAFLVRAEDRLAATIPFQGQDIPVSASMGIAVFPDDASDAEGLVGKASLALRRTSADPLRRYGFYDSAFDETMRRRQALSLDLALALPRGELEVHYQPQIRVADNRLIGFEALLRWNHPTLGAIAPSEFVPLAEQSRIILDIGDWVLNRACASAAGWPMPWTVAVNLSPMQMGQEDLPARIHEALLRSSLPARRLEIELTESTIVADRPRALHILRQIRALGVRLSLDDFGTGYSSLEVLRTFPFDKIKLDRSFMAELDTSRTALPILRAALALGRGLGLAVIAEGVETEAQLALLRVEGCDEAQGYLIGHPAREPVEPALGQRRIRLAG